MDITQLLGDARESLTARRVYAEPFEKDGVTVIAAASVTGGGGGGSGHDQEGQDGEGAGFGLAARPVGAFVIKDGQVTWQPAVDVNRAVASVGAVLVAYLLMRPRMTKAHARAAKRLQG